jgi:hypothetical protein
VVQEEFEAAAFEVGAVALQVIGAKLIEHQDNDQLRMRVVRGRGCARGRGKKQGPDRETGKESLGDRHGLFSIAKFPASKDGWRSLDLCQSPSPAHKARPVVV